MFPEATSTRQLLIGLDVRVRIKADGFDFYAINCKLYGLPINRPHPLSSLIFRLFSFESMRSEGLRLDLSMFPSRGCVSNEQQELKTSMLSFNILQRLPLSSDFKIKKHRFRYSLRPRLDA